MNPNAVKRKIASVFDATGINSAAFALQKGLLSPFVRVVNYHDIHPQHIGNFEAHLGFYSERFVNVNETALRDLLKNGKWPHRKPGIIISFDDGMRSHFEVAAPLLEKYGFTGWFFVPAGWIAERIALNQEAADHVGDQSTLTTEQIRQLDSSHVVGCHTETHCRLTSDLPEEKVRFETLGAKKSLEDLLGRTVDIFCWVGGEENTYSKTASDLIRQAYSLGFMTNTAVVRPGTDPMQIQRTNIEAENPMSLVRFQLGGFLDLIYLPKRRRVNRLTR
jgi:peptidoglycan/xylan/chitin deacetylase (PgdA/CDA1 family)